MALSVGLATNMTNWNTIQVFKDKGIKPAMVHSAFKKILIFYTEYCIIEMKDYFRDSRNVTINFELM